MSFLIGAGVVLALSGALASVLHFAHYLKDRYS